jgi:hypothetical protein
MAKIYARYVGFAPLETPASPDKDTPAVYGEGGFIGKLMTVSVTPTIAKTDLYGDDETAESVSETANAAVSVGVTALPWDIGAKMFGFTVTGAEGAREIVNKSDDTSSEGRFCYCYGEVVDGKKHFYVVDLPKTVFDLPADSVTTRGNSITFSTPTIAGTASPDPTGTWRHIYECESFAAAKEKLKKLLNIN